MKVKRFEDLEIWQLSRDLCKFVYKITERIPFKNDFRFVAQIRSSSGSVMDNISEGFERDGDKEFKQFLYIAKGSCGETRSQNYRAYDFKYITNAEQIELNDKCVALNIKIAAMINYLKKSNLSGNKYKT
ncbi:MAG: four helix bundle protein [Candidatus Marinimicrobia bacterium]|nr:four helix bundle protein [Candidatus Neomarinimicrobiota bacterium]